MENINSRSIYKLASIKWLLVTLLAGISGGISASSDDYEIYEVFGIWDKSLGKSYAINDDRSSNPRFYFKVLEKGWVDIKITTLPKLQKENDCTKAIDTYLYLINAVGGLIAENDDIGSLKFSNNSFIDSGKLPENRINIPPCPLESGMKVELKPGAYTLVAATYKSGESASFFLSIGGNKKTISSLSNKTITDHQIMRGNWEKSGGYKDKDNSGNKFYTFNLDKKAEVTIDLTADKSSLGIHTNDTYLYLLNADGTLNKQDDDSGGDLQSRINKSLNPGRYKIIATTYRPEKKGKFTLNLEAPNGVKLQELQKKVFQCIGVDENCFDLKSSKNEEEGYEHALRVHYSDVSYDVSLDLHADVVSLTSENNLVASFEENNKKLKIRGLGATKLTAKLSSGREEHLQLNVVPGRVKINFDDNSEMRKNYQSDKFPGRTAKVQVSEDYYPVGDKDFHGKPDVKLIYSSSNQKVARVDSSSGEISLIAPGKTTIRAYIETTGNKKYMPDLGWDQGQYSLTVFKGIYPTPKLNLPHKNYVDGGFEYDLNEGFTQLLNEAPLLWKYIKKDDRYPNAKYRVSSNNIDIVNIQDNYLLIKRFGVVSISVFRIENDKYQSSDPVTFKLTIKGLSRNLKVDDMKELEYKHTGLISPELVFFKGAKENPKITYKIISGKEFVDTDSQGKIRMLGPGTAKVEVTVSKSFYYDSETTTFDITVIKATPTFSVDKINKDYSPNGPIIPKPKFNNGPADVDGVSYKVIEGNEFIGLDGNGQLKMLGAGTAMVTAFHPGNEYYGKADHSFKITIGEGTQPSFTIKDVEHEYSANKSITPTPDNGETYDSLSYKVISGEEFVHSDGSGKLTILGVGTAKVKATRIRKHYRDTDYTFEVKVTKGNRTLSVSNFNKDYSPNGPIKPKPMVDGSVRYEGITYEFISGRGVVEFDEKNHRFKIKGVGEAKVRATLLSTKNYKSDSDDFSITVNMAKQKKVELENKSESIKLSKKKYQIKILNIGQSDLQFESKHKDIAVVDNQGLVTIKSENPNMALPTTAIINVWRKGNRNYHDSKKSEFKLQITKGDQEVVLKKPENSLSYNSKLIDLMDYVDKENSTGGEEFEFRPANKKHPCFSINNKNLRFNYPCEAKIQVFMPENKKWQKSQERILTLQFKHNEEIQFYEKGQNNKVIGKDKTVNKNYGDANFTILAKYSGLNELEIDQPKFNYQVTKGSDVAEVNLNTGEVTIKGTGEATIQVKVSNDDKSKFFNHESFYKLKINRAHKPIELNSVDSIIQIDQLNKKYSIIDFIKNDETQGFKYKYFTNSSHALDIDDSDGKLTAKSGGIFWLEILRKETDNYYKNSSSFMLLVAKPDPQPQPQPQPEPEDKAKLEKIRFISLSPENNNVFKLNTAANKTVFGDKFDIKNRENCKLYIQKNSFGDLRGSNPDFNSTKSYDCFNATLPLVKKDETYYAIMKFGDRQGENISFSEETVLRQPKFSLTKPETINIRPDDSDKSFSVPVKFTADTRTNPSLGVVISFNADKLEFLGLRNVQGLKFNPDENSNFDRETELLKADRFKNLTENYDKKYGEFKTFTHLNKESYLKYQSIDDLAAFDDKDRETNSLLILSWRTNDTPSLATWQDPEAEAAGGFLKEKPDKLLMFEAVFEPKADFTKDQTRINFNYNYVVDQKGENIGDIYHFKPVKVIAADTIKVETHQEESSEDTVKISVDYHKDETTKLPRALTLFIGYDSKKLTFKGFDTDTRCYTQPTEEEKSRGNFTLHLDSGTFPQCSLVSTMELEVEGSVGQERIYSLLQKQTSINVTRVVRASWFDIGFDDNSFHVGKDKSEASVTLLSTLFKRKDSFTSGSTDVYIVQQMGGYGEPLSYFQIGEQTIHADPGAIAGQQPNQEKFIEIKPSDFKYDVQNKNLDFSVSYSAKTEKVSNITLVMHYEKNIWDWNGLSDIKGLKYSPDNTDFKPELLKDWQYQDYGEFRDLFYDRPSYQLEAYADDGDLKTDNAVFMFWARNDTDGKGTFNKGSRGFLESSPNNGVKLFKTSFNLKDSDNFVGSTCINFTVGLPSDGIGSDYQARIRSLKITKLESGEFKLEAGKSHFKLSGVNNVYSPCNNPE